MSAGILEWKKTPFRNLLLRQNTNNKVIIFLSFFFKGTVSWDFDPFFLIVPLLSIHLLNYFRMWFEFAVIFPSQEIGGVSDSSSEARRCQRHRRVKLSSVSDTVESSSAVSMTPVDWSPEYFLTFFKTRFVQRKNVGWGLKYGDTVPGNEIDFTWCITNLIF